jgi:hypothetical protein
MEYIILKNGKATDFGRRNMEDTINLIRLLESSLDRNTQHSPYTIAIADGDGVNG